MELPRVTSQSSICPPGAAARTPVSQKLLSVQPPAEPQFYQIPSASLYQPSRRREEARVLQNLRRRVQSVRVVNANKREPDEAAIPLSQKDLPDLHNDNRPQLFQKILSNRPVSMILDVAETRTAWQDSDFITDCLCWHNVYRQRHSCDPLTMSPELCHLAQTWANHLAHTNRFYYRNDKDIGQNLFCRPDNGDVTNDISGQEVSTYWYSAVKQYDFVREPDVLHANVNAGHFTQLVWANSRNFGVGKARSRSGKIVVVAHYAPPGNISGAFENNVLPPVLEIGPNIPPPPKFLLSSDGTESETNSSTNHSQST